MPATQTKVYAVLQLGTLSQPGLCAATSYPYTHPTLKDTLKKIFLRDGIHYKLLYSSDPPDSAA